MNPIKWLTTSQAKKMTTGSPEVKQVEVPQTVNKTSLTGMLGSVLDSGKKLSSETTVSKKLLEANRDWVYKNNDVIAKEVAELEFELFSVKISGGQFVYEEIEDHPLLETLDKFNETTTKSDGLYITQSHKKLTGDAFWLLDGEGSDINNIFILQPDQMELKLGDFTTGDKRLVEAYIYKQVVDGATKETTYDPEQIIPFKTANPNNPYRGYGVVEAAASSIDLDQLTTELSKKFFQNGAISNFLLTTEGRIQEEQLRRLKREFKGAYGGINNAFKTIILGGGLKPESIQQSNKEMEFLAQLEWYRDKIMTLFGNTKASLGIIDDVNRASHESSIVSWKRNSVKPDMSAIVNTLNEFLVPRYGENLILGYKDPIPEDRAAKIEEVKILVESKLLSRNEAREMLGIDPVDGEEHDIVPIPTEMPPALQNVDTDKIFRQRGLYKKRADYRRYKEIGRELAKKSIAKTKTEPTVQPNEEKPVHNTFSNDKVRKYIDKQLGAVEQVEARFYNKVEQFVLKVKEIALASYPEQQPKQYAKALFNEEELLVQAEFDFYPLLKDIALIAGAEALALIDSDQQYFAFDYEKTIRANVKKFTQSMLDTESEKMTQIIAQGLQDGKSIPAIRREMGEAFDNLSKVQAERVTRTEVIRASNEASVDAWKQSGVVEGKQWIATEDDRTDAECMALDGKIVWNLGGDFYNTKNEFENGDPPLHPNCRCVTIAVLDKEKYFDTATLQKIAELEAQVDKRTKSYRELKEKELERDEYIRELEALVGINE